MTVPDPLQPPTAPLTAPVTPEADEHTRYLTPEPSGSMRNPASGSVPSWVRIARGDGGLRTLGNYDLGPVLGQGGMGMVVLAYDRVLSRSVALKIVRDPNPVLLERFNREARAQARVSHPNVCKVFETGLGEGLTYIAMQHIHGQTLSDLGPEVPPEERVRLLRIICEALQEAHQLGLIHRDIKPGNIMVETLPDGVRVPYLLDFGLARDSEEPAFTVSGTVMGTPAYMAPEQARGAALDRRADLYSLGATLYFLLTGRAPFQGAQAEIFTLLLTEDPVAPRKLVPAIHPDLEAIVLRCLEKDPGRRYGSARELGADLQRWLEGMPVHANPSGPLVRASKSLARLRRNRLAWRMTVAGAVALAALSVLGAWTLVRTRRRSEFVARTSLVLIRVEGLLRASEMGPVHDLRADRRKVAGLLDQIRTEAASYGSLAKGPLAYALGRSFLAMHDYDKARDELQEAWRLDYRTPEVAESLGRALGGVYRLRLQGLEAENDRERRKMLQEQLRRTLQEPALHYLGLARGGTSEDLDFRAALAETLSGDYRAAQARTGRLLEADPLGFTYLKLRAADDQGLADRALEKGEHASAQASLEDACRTLRQSLEIARSDKEGWLNLAKAATSLIELCRNLKGDPFGPYALGLEACRKASTLDPEDPEPLLREADLIQSLAVVQGDKGMDPAGAHREAIARLDAALRLDPGYMDAALLRGKLFWNLANLAVDRRQPCQDLFSAAEDQLRQVLAHRPGDVTAAGFLLEVTFDRCVDRERRGEDILPTLDQAVALLRKSRELDPDNSRIRNLGLILGIQRGMVRSNRGQDPLPDWTAALALADEALARNPSSISALTNRSLLLRLRAEHEWRLHLPYEDDLKEAIDTARRGFKVRETNEIIINLAVALGLRGKCLARAGGDPRPDLDEALALFDRAEVQDPRDLTIRNDRLEARLPLIEWLQGRGQASAPVLRACHADMEAGRRMAPDDFDLLADSAQVLELEALEAGRGGRSPLALLEQALATLARLPEAARLTPEHLALRGRLLKRLASSRKGAEAERQGREGQALLNQALAENPFLRREFSDTPG